MNKGTLLRKVNEKIDKITNVVYELRDLLDEADDEQLSELGNDFTDALIDFIATNDTATSGDILDYIQEYFEK
jgi:hypothetical protein